LKAFDSMPIMSEYVLAAAAAAAAATVAAAAAAVVPQYVLAHSSIVSQNTNLY